jgi:predicted enzyme related to lactoylglutathione lyase
MELGTTDVDAAKRFYGGLFGWTFQDMPVGPDMTYTMVSLGQQVIGGLSKMGAEMAGAPPHWSAYVTVENIENAVKKVTANGGKVIKDAFDVMDAGRMAVVQDPTGAAFCMWQAKQHIGAGVKQEVGAMCFNELFTTNVDAAGKFYANTFGWKPEAMDMGAHGTYTLFKMAPDAGNIGGMMAMPPSMKGVPSNWITYIQVADCDASTKKVTELGGKVIVPPQDIPNIGRFSMVQDPAGATFALFKNIPHGTQKN